MTAYPPLPFDPELAAALEVLAAERPPIKTLESIPAVRAAAAKRQISLEEITADGTLEVSEVDAEGPRGPIPLIVARPAGAVDAPVLYWLHGGGMVIGGHKGGDLYFLKEYATELGLGFVCVDYRVAPEHPHPAPVEDCYAGLEWTVKHAAEYGFDASRVVIGGASAGGGLAAATALLARDRGGPELIGQLLVYPMLDDRNDSPSAIQMAEMGSWDRAANNVGWTALLGDARGGPDVSPRARRPRVLKTCPAFRPRSSTSGAPRPSATRSSPTRTGCGCPGCRRNCTSGPAPSTASTARLRRRRCRSRPAPSARRGCGGCSAEPDKR